MFHWPEDINPDIVDELTNTIQSESEKDDEENEDYNIYVEILN